MATQLPYKYQDSMDEDQDPYRRVAPDDGAITEPVDDVQPVREPEPKPEPAPKTSAPEQPAAPAQTPTFKDMQESGHARPPMPPQMLPGAAGLMQQSMGPENIVPETGLPFGVTSEAPPLIVEPDVAQPPIVGTVDPTNQTINPRVPATLPPEIVEDLPPDTGVGVGDNGDADGAAIDAIVEPMEPDLLPLIGSASVADDTGGELTSPESSLDLLNLLTTRLQEPGDLRTAIEASALDRINNPSPFNAGVVKDLYSDLGAGVDADYDARIRGLDEGMARRGLFGSLGKDFHSGRLADTELGRRDAKTTLAKDLARNFAQSYGDYQSDSVNQGLGVTGTGDARTLDYVRSILGLGQQGFENDMAVAQFNANQNDEYQRLLQMMLAAGYGA